MTDSNYRKKNFLLRKLVKLADIDIEWLDSFGIQGIILDLDNTIVSEDDKYLSPDAEIWISNAKQSGFKFFILSNGKRNWRVKFWSLRLDILAISPAKKPFPYAFLRAISCMDLQPKRVVVIGDSLHTDVAGAWLSGCWCIQVSTLPHKPRWWEKLAGKWLQTPYTLNDLWEFDISDYSDGLDNKSLIIDR